MADWPHQTEAVEAAAAAIMSGVRRLCITSPTGMGKTLIAQRIIEWGQPTVLYVNRSMLLEQTMQGWAEAGMDFGVQAADYLPVHGDPIQTAMIQTVDKRWRSGRMDLHDAEIVLVDEAHNEKSERAKRILDEHVRRGATIIGFTATPVGIGDLYDELIVAGRVSDGRKCGALVHAEAYAPDEPSLKAFKGKTKGMLQFEDGYKEVMLPVIFGRCVEHFKRLNPEYLPSVLFAPGVAESRWFAEQFNAAGIPWSHIDGDGIILNGVEMDATPENRALLAEASKSRRTVGVSNRFVLREAINWPWLRHGILACTFGSLVPFLQVGGRLLRASDGKPHATIQDHGGNWLRHDSLNADRDWSLDDTDGSLQEKHDSALRDKQEPEPIVCPKCFKVRRAGPKCPHCGFQHTSRVRTVIEIDGTLKQVHGDAYNPRKTADKTEAEQLWSACYFRCKKAGKTFAQAKGLFVHMSKGKYPPDGLAFMPLHASDWRLPITDVPYDRLTKGKYHHPSLARLPEDATLFDL